MPRALIGVHKCSSGRSQLHPRLSVGMWTTSQAEPNDFGSREQAIHAVCEVDRAAQASPKARCDPSLELFRWLQFSLATMQYRHGWPRPCRGRCEPRGEHACWWWTSPRPWRWVVDSKRHTCCLTGGVPWGTCPYEETPTGLPRLPATKYAPWCNSTVSRQQSEHCSGTPFSPGHASPRTSPVARPTARSGMPSGSFPTGIKRQSHVLM